jgi:DNA invertase Pin-like site-specific DNA recombinase
MRRKVGYIRVGKIEQTEQIQYNALKMAECNPAYIFTETVSSLKDVRPELEHCLKFLSKGDVLVVWRLDRLGKSMPQLLRFLEELFQKGIDFQSLTESAIDTTTASGEAVIQVIRALVQFERREIQERTMVGLSMAKARGRIGGRKHIQATDPKVITAKKLFEDKSIKTEDICKVLKISRPTLYRYLSLE